MSRQEYPAAHPVLHAAAATDQNNAWQEALREVAWHDYAQSLAAIGSSHLANLQLDQELLDQINDELFDIVVSNHLDDEEFE